MDRQELIISQTIRTVIKLLDKKGSSAAKIMKEDKFIRWAVEIFFSLGVLQGYKENGVGEGPTEYLIEAIIKTNDE